MDRVKLREVPIIGIIGAAVAVAVLAMQLFWSQDINPGLRHMVEIILTVAVVFCAAVTAIDAVRKAKKKRAAKEETTGQGKNN